MATRKKQPVEQLCTGEPPARIFPNMFYGMTLDEEQEAFANAIWDKDGQIPGDVTGITTDSPTGEKDSLCAECCFPSAAFPSTATG